MKVMNPIKVMETVKMKTKKYAIKKNYYVI